jgi:hypothetical protein
MLALCLRFVAPDGRIVEMDEVGDGEAGVQGPSTSDGYLHSKRRLSSRLFQVDTALPEFLYAEKAKYAKLPSSVSKTNLSGYFHSHFTSQCCFGAAGKTVCGQGVYGTSIYRPWASS